MRYHKHIDGLRCIAVMSVFLMHLGISGFGGGFVGVDVFFVISGFLISNLIIEEISQTGKFSFLTFYCRRALRILPALFFMLSLSFLVAVVFLDPAQFIVFGKSLVAAVFAVSNIFFYHQSGYFDVYSQSSPLLHTWSLGVEEQFYLFWPIAIVIASKLFHDKKCNGIMIIIFSVFLISMLINLVHQHHNHNIIYYYAPFRAFEFCMGAMLVYLVKFIKKCSNMILELLCLAGMLMIACAIYSYSSQTLFPSYHALLPAMGAALLIFAGSAKYLGSVLRVYPVRYIGLISYSLYLVHWPLIVFLKTARQDMGLGYTLPGWLIYFVLLTALLVAHFMFRFIEQPFRRKMPKVKSQKIKVLVFSMVAVLPLSLLGISSTSFALWKWRIMPGDVQYKHIDNYHLDHWGGAGFSGGYIYRGNTAYPKLVMLGDSHSGMLDTGIVNVISKPFAITTYTASGGGAGKYLSALALPGLTRESSQDQELYDNASVSQDKDALNILRKTENSTLMLSFSYASQLNSTAFIKTHQLLGIHPSTMAYLSEYKSFVHSLDELRLEMGGRKLIIIGDVPGSSYLPIDCLESLRWFPIRKSCTVQDSVKLNVAAVNINRVLSEYAKEHKNVYFINPYKVFCSGLFCRSVNAKGVPYYSDGSHLSKTGSNYLIKKVKSKIMDVLFG